MKSENKLLIAALDYAARGWHVIPVKPKEKLPLIKDWPGQATIDPEKIKGWFKQWPTANIGLLLGQKSGLVVLDVDGPKGSDQVLGLHLPETITATSGKDHGCHYFFKAPEHPVKRKVRLFDEVDLLAENSFIIVSPSVHPSGRQYSFVNLDGKDPAPLPQAILDLVKSEPVPKSPAAEPGEIIPRGQRDKTLTSWAGKMRHIGLTFEEILVALIEKNRSCDSPLTRADLERIARSVTRYEPGSDIDESRLTDLGLCQRFVREHGSKLKFCSTLGAWLIWDGCRWAADERDEVFQMAKRTVRSLYQEAANCPSQDFREKIGKFAVASEGAAKIAAFLALAKRELTIPITDLDADTALLNCRSAVFNFRTGEILAPEPTMLLTMATAAIYDSAAECPLWEKTLQEVFQNDGALIRYFQKAAGAALLGENKERVLIECQGEGGNGKSVILNSIKKSLGDYATSTPAQTLMTKKPGSIPNDLAALRGKRFVLASESDRGARISEGTLKLLAGGSDEVNARFLNREWFSFKPSFLVFLMTNHRPLVSGDDEAIWDRIRLVPFERRFAPEERNLNLETELSLELPGILRWLIDGAKLAAAEGLGKNEKVASATASYREDQNPVARFVVDVCETGPCLSWQAKPLFQLYVTWSAENREPITFSQSRFARALERLGFKKEKMSGVVRYFGLKPIIEEDQGPAEPPEDMERF